MGVIDIVITSEPDTLFQIGPGGCRRRLGRHHFGIMRGAVLKLAPFEVEPLFFRRLRQG